MFEEEMNKSKARKQALTEMVDMMVKFTGDANLIYLKRAMELSNLLDEINPANESITDLHYQELANMLGQFKKLVEDYIKENNIVIKEED